MPGLNAKLEKEALDHEEGRRLAERHAAIEARTVLDNPRYKAAWADVRAALHRELDALPMSAPVEQVQDVRRCLKLLDKVEVAIAKHVETGKMAEARLAEIEEKRKFYDRFKRGAAA